MNNKPSSISKESSSTETPNPTVYQEETTKFPGITTAYHHTTDTLGAIFDIAKAAVATPIEFLLLGNHTPDSPTFRSTKALVLQALAISDAAQDAANQCQEQLLEIEEDPRVRNSALALPLTLGAKLRKSIFEGLVFTD